MSFDKDTKQREAGCEFYDVCPLWVEKGLDDDHRLRLCLGQCRKGTPRQFDPYTPTMGPSGRKLLFRASTGE
jgi:hypothetical protein